MKFILALAMCFFQFAFVNAQTNVKETTPQIVEVAAVDTNEYLSLKETEYDFGKIPQGKPVTHTFSVSNTGASALQINNVVASCGCTTPEWERNKALNPNEATDIKVGYNAAAAGSFTKTITITYDGTKSKTLTIKGEVWATPVTSAPENKSTNDL